MKIHDNEKEIKSLANLRRFDEVTWFGTNHIEENATLVTDLDV